VEIVVSLETSGDRIKALRILRRFAISISNVRTV
jgi:hypothetical protein